MQRLEVLWLLSGTHMPIFGGYLNRLLFSNFYDRQQLVLFPDHTPAGELSPAGPRGVGGVVWARD